MAEQLVNEFTVNRPIEEAWPVICDVERIAPCLPGAELTETVDDTLAYFFSEWRQKNGYDPGRK